MAARGDSAIERLAEDFLTFRGSYRFKGIIQLGTQMSLARRPSGKYLLLDSYTLEGEDKSALLVATDGGKAIEAVLNLHPFHTLHCEAVHALLPHAAHYGTRRHHRLLPNLPWRPGAMEDAETQAMFADTLDLSVPTGVDFVCEDETVHVASVLARHRASRIVHVDDTLNVLAPPSLLKPLLPEPKIRFHPMLKKALGKRAGAADDYARWAKSLAEDWADTPVVCAAHSSIRRLPEGGFRREVLDALDDSEGVLAAHREQYG